MPIMVCDPDDWSYISYIRTPIPLWKDWNPAKILPETAEGLLGYFAAYVVYPICGDYINSFTYTFAGFVAVCIALYVVYSAILLKKIIPGINDAVCIISAYFMFLINFIMLRGNNFLFTASNLNCFINYFVPSLFCMILLNYLLSSDIICLDKQMQSGYKSGNGYAGLFKTGTILLAIYLAVFSNMVCNVILVVPMAMIFLNSAFRRMKEHKLKEFLLSYKQSGIYYYTFILEIICLVFEYNGGRANSFSASFAESLKQTREDLDHIWNITNKAVLICCLLLIILCLVLNIKKKRNEKVSYILICFLVSFTIITLYLAALYTKIGDHKLQRCENIFVMYILFIEATMVALGYLLDRYMKAVIIVPMLAFIMTAIVIYGDYKPSFSYYWGDKNLCYAINTSIVKQFEIAERTENYEFELHIPKSGLGGYDFSGNRIAATLHKHGITASTLKPHLVLEEFSYFADIE